MVPDIEVLGTENIPRCFGADQSRQRVLAREAGRHFARAVGPLVNQNRDPARAGKQAVRSQSLQKSSIRPICLRKANSARVVTSDSFVRGIGTLGSRSGWYPRRALLGVTL